MMVGSKRYRLAAAMFFAAGVVAFTAGAASAFTLQNVGPAGNGASTFADPDDHLTTSDQGVKPLGPNGPVVQFGIQQGPVSSFGRFDGNGFDTSPTPDPYYGSLTNRN